MPTSSRHRGLLAAVLSVVALSIVPAGASSSTGSRSLVDRPGTTGLRVHLVYLVAKGQKDHPYDTTGALAAAAANIQSWFRRETGGREIRLDTYVSGGRRVPDISFVRSSRSAFICRDSVPTQVEVPDQHCEVELVHAKTTGPSDAPVDMVADDLAKAGFSDPQVRYLVLAQGSAGIICGMSQGPDDTDRDPTHVGHVAAVFLGETYCPDDSPGLDGQVEWELTHEYLHNDGAVPLGAPHQCAGTSGHVCTAGLANGSPMTDSLDPERADIMYPSPGVPLSQAHLDRGHDDYYGTTLGLRDVADSPYITGHP